MDAAQCSDGRLTTRGKECAVTSLRFNASGAGALVNNRRANESAQASISDKDSVDLAYM